MSERVLRGYDHVTSAPPCPYCGHTHYAIIDDGSSDTVRVDCWCGAHSRCRRDDPDLIALLGDQL